MKRTARFVAAGVAALALAGGVSAGIASADPSSPAPSPSASASATTSPQSSPKADHKRPLLAARALHGEVTLAGKKHRVVDFQRGTVSEVSSTSITVKSSDGFTATYVVDAKTKVKVRKDAAAIGDVKTADRVRVTAVRDSSTVTAKRIADRGPK